MGKEYIICDCCQIGIGVGNIVGIFDCKDGVIGCCFFVGFMCIKGVGVQGQVKGNFGWEMGQCCKDGYRFVVCCFGDGCVCFVVIVDVCVVWQFDDDQFFCCYIGWVVYDCYIVGFLFGKGICGQCLFNCFVGQGICFVCVGVWFVFFICEYNDYIFRCCN